MKIPVLFRLSVLGFLAAPGLLSAWDYPGHRMVNQLALASLPADFPRWVSAPANAERIAFLADEPDRWRNTRAELLQHANGLEHYCDLDEITAAGLDLATLTPFRYDFVAAFAAGRAAHLDRFAPIDPAQNADRSREWPGFLPWRIAEDYAKLQSAFSSLKTYERYGTAAEAANARADVIYLMGVGGHFVGDGSQPLHTTVHFNGWVGPNPKGYTTRRTLHAWIDGGFIAQAGITRDELAPRLAEARPLDLASRADGRDPVFAAIVEYLRVQSLKVEPLYQLEQAGGFKVAAGQASPEGRAFISAQLLAGGAMLGDLWLTAWRQAAPDLHLRKQLITRPR